MPAERSIAKKYAASAGRISKNVEPCIICGKVVCRTSDIPRHMKKHDSEAKKFACPWEGCTFSALQKSNLDTHYRRHTRDKSYLCQDDANCHFQTVDPACLLRHRKRMHGYIPRSFYRRNTGKPSKAQANPEPETSINFSVKLASPFLFNESASSSPVATSNLLPLNESFSNCLYPFPYDYTWDAPSQSELLATQSEMMEQIEFHQDQQENCQPPENLFAPQFPDRKQTFPGYKTTGQLYGSYGLDLNPVFDPSPEPAGLAMFTNATNARLHQVPSVSDFNDLVNLQTYSSPDSINLYASSIGHSQLTDFNGEMLNSVDLYLSNSQLSASDYQIPSFVNLSAPNLDYFDQF